MVRTFFQSERSEFSDHEIWSPVYRIILPKFSLTLECQFSKYKLILSQYIYHKFYLVRYLFSRANLPMASPRIFSFTRSHNSWHHPAVYFEVTQISLWLSALPYLSVFRWPLHLPSPEPPKGCRGHTAVLWRPLQTLIPNNAYSV